MAQGLVIETLDHNQITALCECLREKAQLLQRGTLGARARVFDGDVERASYFEVLARDVESASAIVRYQILED